MRIKEIYIEAKKSKNFQTYTMGELITIEDTDNDADIERIKQEAITRCRKLCMDQIKIDGENK